MKTSIRATSEISGNETAGGCRWLGEPDANNLILSPDSSSHVFIDLGNAQKRSGISATCPLSMCIVLHLVAVET
jgi:hypothetical protein